MSYDLTIYDINEIDSINQLCLISNSNSNLTINPHCSVITDTSQSVGNQNQNNIYNITTDDWKYISLLNVISAFNMGVDSWSDTDESSFFFNKIYSNVAGNYECNWSITFSCTGGSVSGLYLELGWGNSNSGYVGINSDPIDISNGNSGTINISNIIPIIVCGLSSKFNVEYYSDGPYFYFKTTSHTGNPVLTVDYTVNIYKL